MAIASAFASANFRLWSAHSHQVVHTKFIFIMNIYHTLILFLLLIENIIRPSKSVWLYSWKKDMPIGICSEATRTQIDLIKWTDYSETSVERHCFVCLCLAKCFKFETTERKISRINFLWAEKSERNIHFWTLFIVYFHLQFLYMYFYMKVCVNKDYRPYFVRPIEWSQGNEPRFNKETSAMIDLLRQNSLHLASYV